MKYLLVSSIIFLVFSCKNAEPKIKMNPDWPNLKKYAKQNKALHKKEQDEQRIVFMGNSITEGWIQDSLDFFDNPSFINRGISGQTTPQMLTRFRTDVIDLRPKAVVILAGINDIAHNTGPMTIAQTMANLKSMAQLADINNIQVLMCSVLPASSFKWRPNIDPSDKVNKLNKMIKEYADKQGYLFVDYYQDMVNENKGLKSEYTYDEVHCTLDGYRKMELIIKPILDKI